MKKNVSGKTSQEIKGELAKCYFGKEARTYDCARVDDPRKVIIFDIQKKITKDFLSSAGGSNILDIACGTGRFFPLYSPREIYGIDVSSEMLSQAKKRTQVKKLQVADAENLPFKENIFDIVSTSQFIMHTPYYPKVISEMARVAKKGGSVIIDFPNRNSLSGCFFSPRRVKKGSLRHFNLFKFSEIKKIAEKNNLDIAEVRGTVVFSPRILPRFLWRFSRWLNKILIKLFPFKAYTLYVHFVKKE